MTREVTVEWLEVGLRLEEPPLLVGPRPRSCWMANGERWGTWGAGAEEGAQERSVRPQRPAAEWPMDAELMWAGC